MWSTNLEAQAELARERFTELRRSARRSAQYRAQRRHKQATALAVTSGRLLARSGAWLLALGRRLQQDDAECTPAATLS